MVFVNAKDDPIVPEALLKSIRDYSGDFFMFLLLNLLLIANDFLRLYTANNTSTMYVELAHGGHLGFYEGGLIYPNPVTWLDRAVVAMVGGIVLSHHGDIYKEQALNI